MRNILIFVVLLIVAFALLALVQPNWVTPPAKDGAGPLAVMIDARLVAPEYHKPIGWWRTLHMDALNGGVFKESDCLYCHDAANSCNNCLAYVGVRQITTP